VLTNTYSRLLPIINSIDKSVVCQSVTDNTDGTYTFLCKDTGYLTSGFTVTIGLVDYFITDFDCNVSFTVSGASLPTQLTFDLYAPKFKHGTITKVASELKELTELSDRLPLIFLHEIIEEKRHLSELDIVDSDNDVRLYFLIDCNFADWTQLQGDSKGVQPMRNLTNRFIKALAESPYVGELNGIGSIKNYNVFGNTTDNGVTKNIFAEYLSGTQLKITISFLKDCDCCDGTDLINKSAPAYVYDGSGNVLAVLYSNEIYVSTGSGGVVTIKDINTGATITTVNAGDIYEVEQLTQIVDTVFSNTITIIDPII
jgi:hypothetical protein